VGIVDSTSISVSVGKRKYSNGGIKEHGTFSVNIPSVDLVEKTDYCGSVSGRKTDKSALFTNFYGALETAPMIEECPINMACRVIQTLELTTHDAFVGEIVETYCDEAYLVDGKVDFARVQPILFTTDSNYCKLGERFAQAWHVGRKLNSQ
jgi:flavin reductase (DIM6/NTAB) family NADH-FMN oxidoreductase RutF